VLVFTSGDLPADLVRDAVRRAADRCEAGRGTGAGPRSGRARQPAAWPQGGDHHCHFPAAVGYLLLSHPGSRDFIVVALAARTPDMSGYCAAAPGHEWHGPYHEAHYGFPIGDDDMLFERLILEINQAGLSWLTILKRQDAFRKAFRDFKIEK